MDNQEKEQELHQYTPFTHEEFYKRYYVHRVAASTIVLNAEKKLLLVKEIRRGKYIWGLPGGILERQESLITGLLREVKEETNCEIEPYGILGITNWAGNSIFKSDTKIQSGFHFILASKYISGDPKPDGEEVFETEFFSPDDFQELRIHESIPLFCKAVENNKFLPLNISNYENGDRYRFVFTPF